MANSNNNVNVKPEPFSLNTVFQELESRETSLLLQINTLQKQNHTLEERNTLLSQEISLLKAQMVECEQKSKSLSDEIVDLKVENTEIKCSRMRAETEAGIWKWRFLDLERRVLHLEEEIEGLSKDIETRGKSGKVEAFGVAADQNVIELSDSDSVDDYIEENAANAQKAVAEDSLECTSGQKVLETETSSIKRKHAFSPITAEVDREPERRKITKTTESSKKPHCSPGLHASNSAERVLKTEAASFQQKHVFSQGTAEVNCEPERSKITNISESSKQPDYTPGLHTSNSEKVLKTEAASIKQKHASTPSTAEVDQQPERSKSLKISLSSKAPSPGLHTSSASDVSGSAHMKNTIVPTPRYERVILRTCNDRTPAEPTSFSLLNCKQSDSKP